jgi:hypothetical protein
LLKLIEYKMKGNLIINSLEKPLLLYETANYLLTYDEFTKKSICNL